MTKHQPDRKDEEALADIFEKYIEKLVEATVNNKDLDTAKDAWDEAIAALNSYILEETLRLIGEDFKNAGFGSENYGRNIEKAELRTAAEQRWGGK